MNDADSRWFSEREAEWARIERRFGGLVINFSGMGFASLLGLMLFPGPAAFTFLFGVLLWVCAVMICLCSGDIERCRQWQDWHAEMRKSPLTWPWRPMPSEA